MYILFFVCLILILLTLPIWPYSHNWGHRVAVTFAIVSLILLCILLRSIAYVKYTSDEDGTEIKIETKPY